MHSAHSFTSKERNENDQQWITLNKSKLILPSPLAIIRTITDAQHNPCTKHMIGKVYIYQNVLKHNIKEWLGYSPASGTNGKNELQKHKEIR